MILTFSGFSLSSELVKPVSKSVLFLGLFEQDHTSVKVLDLEGVLYPFVIVGAKLFPVKHIAYTFQLTLLHAT